MGFLIVFLAGIGAIAAWWLSRQRLAAKSWLEESATGDIPEIQTPSIPARKIGLGVFMAVAGSLFALLFSAWSMQMHFAEGRMGGMQSWTLPIPHVLWLNTVVLIASSAALQQARQASYEGELIEARIALLAAAITTSLFVAGQLLAWRELTMAGYFVAASQASAMFYLLTAMHGVHVLGGLAVLSRTTAKAWSKTPVHSLYPSIELCAIYWHFLLLVWFILFTMLILT